MGLPRQVEGHALVVARVHVRENVGDDLELHEEVARVGLGVVRDEKGHDLGGDADQVLALVLCRRGPARVVLLCDLGGQKASVGWASERVSVAWVCFPLPDKLVAPHAEWLRSGLEAVLERGAHHWARGDGHGEHREDVCEYVLFGGVRASA